MTASEASREAEAAKKEAHDVIMKKIKAIEDQQAREAADLEAAQSELERVQASPDPHHPHWSFPLLILPCRSSPLILTLRIPSPPHPPLPPP